MRWKSKLSEWASIKISPNAMSRTMFIALGCILIFTGVGKLVKPPDLENIWFANIIGNDITNILKAALPYCEIAIGALLCFRIKIKYTAWLALGLIMLFITNNTWLIATDRGFIFCGECLGWGIDLWAIGSLYIDLVMIGILLLGAGYYRKWEATQWAC